MLRGVVCNLCPIFVISNVMTSFASNVIRCRKEQRSIVSVLFLTFLLLVLVSNIFKVRICFLLENISAHLVEFDSISHFSLLCYCVVWVMILGVSVFDFVSLECKEV